MTDKKTDTTKKTTSNVTKLDEHGYEKKDGFKTRKTESGAKVITFTSKSDSEVKY